MKAPAQLPKRFTKQVIALRESGMGFWIVDVRTKSDQIFRRVVIDSGFIVSVDRKKEIPFDPEEIVSFEVTHDRSAIVR